MLEREQWVASPLPGIFPFFAQPENLALITPSSLRFRLLTPSPVVMENGRIIDYSIRVMGLPVRWRTLITRYEPPGCFVDEQISGPYSFWHHTHRFEPRDGGTMLYDEVRYALPMPLIGPARHVAHVLYVRPYLEQIFDYREQVFTRLFGGIPATCDQAPMQVNLHPVPVNINHPTIATPKNRPHSMRSSKCRLKR
jgi:ligand-binding SRPBCC domain-containing protein